METCVICFDTLNVFKKCQIENCNGFVCTSCYINMENIKCPLCRSESLKNSLPVLIDRKMSKNSKQFSKIFTVYLHIEFENQSMTELSLTNFKTEKLAKSLKNYLLSLEVINLQETLKLL